VDAKFIMLAIMLMSAMVDHVKESYATRDGLFELIQAYSMEATIVYAI